MTDPHPSAIWPDVLKELEPTMAKSVFNSWLKNTTAVQHNGTLIISVPSAASAEWLENRLRHPIERTVASVAGHKLQIEFKVASSEQAGYQPDLFFTGTYRDAYNEIVQPDALICTTRYFHDKWRPLLGNDLWLLIWEMRRRCFWNKTNPDKTRDTIEVTFGELAAVVGVSEPTVRRLLRPKKPDKRALLAKFVTRIGVKRGYSNKIGRTVNEKTIWRIRLDDPLTPEDEVRLEQMTASTGQNDQ